MRAKELPKVFPVTRRLKSWLCVTKLIAFCLTNWLTCADVVWATARKPRKLPGSCQRSCKNSRTTSRTLLSIGWWKTSLTLQLHYGNSRRLSTSPKAHRAESKTSATRRTIFRTSQTAPPKRQEWGLPVVAAETRSSRNRCCHQPIRWKA